MGQRECNTTIKGALYKVAVGVSLCQQPNTNISQPNMKMKRATDALESEFLMRPENFFAPRI